MSQRYSPSQFEAFVGPVGIAGFANNPFEDNISSSGFEADRSSNANLASIIEGCSWLYNQVVAPIGQPYPVWLAIAALMSRCKGGLDAFTNMSRKDARFSEYETQDKFNEGLARMRPPTCEYIRQGLLSTACNDCAVRHVVRSPMAFGNLPPDQASLQGEYVFDVGTQRFASVRRPQVYTLSAFKTRFAHLAEKGAITTNIIHSKWGGRVERFVYRPGITERLSQERDGWVFNLWRDTGVKPVEGDCSVILNHLRLVVHIAEELSHLLDYLAFHVQNPGVKIPHGILLRGPQGIGKTFIAALLKLIVGEDNYRWLEPDMLSQPWTSMWAPCQLLVIEEMMSDGRLEIYNRLKTWLSEDEVIVNEKHVPQYKAATPRIVIAITNHNLATLLPGDDRRFFVIASEMERQTPSYYERLWSEGLQQAGAFKHYLAARDVGTFKYGAPPPATVAKQQMLEDSTPPLERALQEMIEERAYPFHRSLVRQDEIRNALHSRLMERPKESALVTAMRAAGLKKRTGQVSLLGGSRPRLWIVRDHDEWETCSPDHVRAELNRSFDFGKE